MIPGETIQSRKLMGMEADKHTSEFKVMFSNAGHYIGTSHTNCGECDDCKESGLPKGYESPGSRETEYFKDRKGAEKALEMFQKTGVLPEQRY